MPIPNDTYVCRLDSGYMHGAALALAVYRPSHRPKPQNRIDRRSPGYILAADVTRLRDAVNLARACLRAGRAEVALAVLEHV